MADNLRELFYLRRDIAFLNHGSFGACPRPVFEDYQKWQREVEAEPVEFLGRRLNGLLREARQALGTLVGAEADDLVFVTNATVGLNIVAHSIPLERGDEVLGTDHEYGAMDRMWEMVCAGRGARYVRRAVPVPFSDASKVVEAVWAGVTDRTRVLFLSHISSPTALTFPVKELVDRARARGIISVVDGAHVLGHLPLDLRALGADFYSANAHKWLLAPKGSAFLYARRDLHKLVQPLVVSWGQAGDPPPATRFVPDNEWQGTRDPSAFLAIPAAIRFQAEHHWDSVRPRCHELLRRTRERLTALTGLPALSADHPSWYCQMASLPLPACDLALLQKRLFDEHHVEVPTVSWGGRNFVRVSVQGYTEPWEIDALVDGLKTLLPQVAAPTA